MNWLPLLADPAAPLREAVAVFERDYIASAIAKCGGDLRATAKFLRVGYSTPKGKVAKERARSAPPKSIF